MKLSKATVLTASAMLLVASAVMEAAAPAKSISNELSNAVLHITTVQLVQKGNPSNGKAIIGSKDYAILVNTNNLLLTQSGAKNTISSSNSSNILGGEGNNITSSTGGVIIAGSRNKIDKADMAVIGGGIGNEIGEGSKSAVIAGGTKNKILKNSAYSTILGGSDNSISGTGSSVAGNNSHVTGNYSVAIGKKANVEANNTFLWTDTGATVSTKDVFAVIGKNGMAINATTPHPEAQLTIGGGLILNAGDKDSSVTCNNDSKGNMKLVNSGSKSCLCSCNGSEWDSVLGEGQCAAICNENLKKPACGNKVERNGCSLEGTCGDGSKVISGTHAYYVDTGGIVHWTCQAVDGSTTECTAKPSKAPSGCSVPTYSCQGTVPGTNTKKSSSAPSLNKNWEYVSNTSATLSACQWTCKDDSYERDGSSMNCKPKSTPTYSCQGTVPDNATLVAGSDQGLTSNVTRKLYASASEASGKKCAYLCNALTHEYKDGGCIPTKNKQVSCGTTKYTCVGTGATLTKTDTMSDTEFKWTCTSEDESKTRSCTYSCPSGEALVWSTLHNGSCTKQPQNCPATMEDGYSVPALNYGDKTKVPATSGNLTCNATFKCDNGKVSMNGGESCSCPAGYTLSPSAGATLRNGSCAKLKWECVNGVARCKNETANKYEQDTVCTNARLTKPTCRTPKTYYITPSITTVTEGTHVEIHLSVVDAQATSANLPDNESFVMYFKYKYQKGTRYYTDTREISGKGNDKHFTIPLLDVNSVRLLNAGFDSSFKKQIIVDGDTYIMNEPSITQSPECGSAHGNIHSSTPQNPHLCAIGNASSVAQPTLANGWKYNWTCSIDGQTKNCSASVKKTATFSITSVGGASAYGNSPHFIVKLTSTPTIQDKHFFDGVTLRVLVRGKCGRHDTTSHVFVPEGEERFDINYHYCNNTDHNYYSECQQNFGDGSRQSVGGGDETAFVDYGGMFAKKVCGWEDPVDDINKVFLLTDVEITSVNGNTKRTDWEFNR